MHYRLNIGGRDFAVEVDPQPAGGLRVAVDGTPYEVTVIRGAPAEAARPAAAATIYRPAAPQPAGAPPAPSAATPGSGAVLAPIPGLILEIKVQVGDRVQAGQAVAVMEAMKMENNLISNVSGVVSEILVQKGSEVATGDVVMRIG